MKRLLAILASLAALAVPVWATEYIVYSTHTTAQAAAILTNAVSGDRVCFQPRAGGLAWTNAGVNWDNLVPAAAWPVPAGVTMCGGGATFDGLTTTRVIYLSTNAVLTNAVVVRGAGAGGGGILGVAGSQVWNCGVINNASAAGGSGGGIQGVALVANSTIVSNYAPVNAGGIDGAGIVVSNCLVNYNLAAGRGGGISINAGTIWGGEIVGNTNNSSLTGGSAILAGANGAIVIGTKITRNVSTAGRSALEGGLEIHSCVVAHNVSSGTGAGGAMRGVFTYASTVFSNTSASTTCAGAYGGSHYNSLFFDNRVQAGAGAVINFNATTVVSNCLTNAVAFIDADYTPPSGWEGQDAGNDTYTYYSLDYRGGQRLTTEGRIVNGVSDIGAVERFPGITPAASGGSGLYGVLLSIIGEGN
jgi:hypothetical protein